jgi:hypothetical protein
MKETRKSCTPQQYQAFMQRLQTIIDEKLPKELRIELEPGGAYSVNHILVKLRSTDFERLIYELESATPKDARRILAPHWVQAQRKLKEAFAQGVEEGFVRAAELSGDPEKILLQFRPVRPVFRAKKRLLD